MKKRCVYAILATIAAWFVGVVLDANIGESMWTGFWQFRTLFPLLTMGGFILTNGQNKDGK